MGPEATSHDRRALDAHIRAKARKARALRWTELVLQAVLAAGVIGVFGSSLAKGSIDVQSTYGWGSWAIPGASAAAVAFLLGRVRRWRALVGLVHVARYPPTWTAVALAVSFLGLYWLAVPTAWSAIDRAAPPQFMFLGIVAMGVAPVALGIIVSWLVEGRRHSARAALAQGAKKDDNGTGQEATVADYSFEQLRGWIQDDAPVDTPERALFGHPSVARRIARRLLDGSSTALVGELGSGKTTIGRLVKEELERNPSARRVRVVHVSIWQFDNSDSVVRGILDALINSLGDEVSTISLSGLPGEYADVVEGLGSPWARLVRSVSPARSPASLLESFDHIALAANLRFALWIEDMERYAGLEADGARQEERIAPIRGLLYLLDALDTVTVVTASTTLQVRFDLGKVARYVERVPPLNEVDSARVIKRFRQGCRAELEGLIDPVDARDRREFAGGDEDDVSERPSWFVGRYPNVVATPLGALAVLCRTPRALKLGLRHCYERWSRLRGEIDYDELLAMSILKEADPSSFGIVEEFFDILRGGDRLAQGSVDGKEQPSAFQERLRRSTESKSGRHHSAIERVLELTFESLRSPRPQREKRPQGLAVVAHVNYWERFLAAPEISASESDQSIIRIVRTATQSAEADLVPLCRLLEHPRLWEAVALFGSNRFTAPHVTRLLELLVQRRKDEPATEWPANEVSPPEAPGLIPLYHLTRDLGRRGKLDATDLAKAIEAAFEQSLPTNLWLADEIEHWFVIAADDKDWFESEVGNTLKVRFRETLCASYEEQPEKLANKLAGLPPYLLLRLCWGLDRLRAEDFEGTPFARWPEFANTILEASRRKPRTMLPQIASFIVRRKAMSDGSNKVEFDRARAARLFGESELRTVFAAEGADLLDEACRVAAAALADDSAA